MSNDQLINVPKRSFIHGIWGNYDKSEANKLYNRVLKVENDMILEKLNPYAPKYRVYVFGEENYKRTIDMGFNAVMVDKRPFIFDMDKEQYRHKLEFWKLGLEEFDEIVFTDWDCLAFAPIPNDFWDVLGKGPEIQSSLYAYKRRWRSPSRGTFKGGYGHCASAATFLYIRGKEHGYGIINAWEELGRPFFEEGSLGKYIDSLDGGWKGLENYIKFEPPYHGLFWAYENKEWMRNRRPIFYHCNHKVISKLIGEKDPIKIKHRLDSMLSNNWLSIDKIL